MTCILSVVAFIFVHQTQWSTVGSTILPRQATINIFMLMPSNVNTILPTPPTDLSSKPKHQHRGLRARPSPMFSNDCVDRNNPSLARRLWVFICTTKHVGLSTNLQLAHSRNVRACIPVFSYTPHQQGATGGAGGAGEYMLVLLLSSSVGVDDTRCLSTMSSALPVQ